MRPSDTVMSVYLVPTAVLELDQYELYCEVADEPLEETSEVPAGFWRRLQHRISPRQLKRRFSEMIAEAERERHRESGGEPQRTGWLGRVKTRTMRFVAESIAEQRLLWHIRHQDHAVLFYPDDLDGAAAAGVLRRQMTRDFEKHRLWLIVDSLGFIASGLLFLVPGPNIIAYYFAFRMVGHYLSLRGARQALDVVAWTNTASVPLSELRRTIGMAPEQRDRRVRDVEHSLQLERLGKFFDRVLTPTP